MVNQSNDGELEFESRTQKKHYAHSMVDLAHKLSELKHSVLIELPISTQIIETITTSKKITSHIARKRHFQFIGKLLLNSDHQTIIDCLESQNKQHTASLIRTPFINQWLELLLEHPKRINDLYTTHNHTDIQTLKQLIRAFHKQQDNTTKNRRKLFEHIRYLDNQTPLPPI